MTLPVSTPPSAASRRPDSSGPVGSPSGDSGGAGSGGAARAVGGGGTAGGGKGAPPGPEVHGLSARKARSRRVGAWAFGLSLLLHVVAILLYPSFSEPPGGRITVLGDPDAPVSPEGTRIVRIAEASDDPDRPEAPETPEEPVAAPETPPGEAPGEEGAAGAEPEADADAEGATAAERIRNTYGDARLLLPLPDEVVDLSPEQIARLQLVWAIEVANDSALAAAAADARGTDWTYTDDEGQKWGFSEGQIHLGGISLPFPFSFSGPPTLEAMQRMRDDEEINRAAIDAAARETREDRARAIRERVDEERRRERADTTGGGGN